MKTWHDVDLHRWGTINLLINSLIMPTIVSVTLNPWEFFLRHNMISHFGLHMELIISMLMKAVFVTTAVGAVLSHS